MFRPLSSSTKAASGAWRHFSRSRRASTSLVDRVFKGPSFVDRVFKGPSVFNATPISLLNAAPISLLPRLLEDEFVSTLESLNRAIQEQGRLVHIGTTTDKSCVLTFDGMGHFDRVSIDMDVAKNVLTVKGVGLEGDALSETMHAVTLPCSVVKPEMVSAEKCEGRVVVKVPIEAQAAPQIQEHEKKAALKDNKIPITILGAPEKPEVTV